MKHIHLHCIFSSIIELWCSHDTEVLSVFLSLVLGIHTQQQTNIVRSYVTLGRILTICDVSVCPLQALATHCIRISLQNSFQNKLVSYYSYGFQNNENINYLVIVPFRGTGVLRKAMVILITKHTYMHSIYIKQGLKCYCLALGVSHYNDVIMGALASQITSLTIVYSNV